MNEERIKFVFTMDNTINAMHAYQWLIQNLGPADEKTNFVISSKYWRIRAYEFVGRERAYVFLVYFSDIEQQLIFTLTFGGYYNIVEDHSY